MHINSLIFSEKTYDEAIEIFPKTVSKPPLDVNLKKSLLKNGPHSLSYIDILSLESTMTTSDHHKVLKIDPQFKIGWLHDEIINSYLYCITRSNENVLYVGTTVAISISHG